MTDTRQGGRRPNPPVYDLTRPVRTAAPRQALSPRGRAPPRRAQGRRRGRGLLYTAAGLLALLGAALTYLAFSIPSDLVRDRVVAAVKARTGRDLTIAGPATFSAVPSARVSLQDVTLASPSGMAGPALATMKSLEVRVALWPLLWRDVVVESIVLNDPVIELSIDADGRRNWDLSRRAAAPSAPVRVADASGSLTDADPPAAAQAPADDRHHPISLQDVRIDNATIRYRDARTGVAREVTAITARAAVKALDQPADAEGTLVYGGEKVAFDLDLASVEPLLDHQPARMALKLSARPITAAYEGTILVGGGEAQGSITAKAPSLAAAAAWLGAALAPDATLGAFDVSGQLHVSGKSYALSDATVTVNSVAATGRLSLDAARERPLVSGDLQVEDLNLNALLTPTVPADAAAAAPTHTTPPVEPSIENLILRHGAEQGGTRVKGYAARGGWSEEAVSVVALAAVDADLKLAAGALHYKDLKGGRSRLDLQLNDRVLKANFTELALYDGAGKGLLTIDAREPALPHVGLNLAFDAVSVGPLLRDAAHVDWLEGKGRVAVSVAGSGASERAVIESLAGTAEARIGSGAIVGIDINKMAEGLSEGRIKALKPQRDDRTAFTDLAGTWTIESGIARNQDLRVASDLVHVTGAGTVALPDRSLDMTIKPKLVAASGQEEGKGLAGIEVPVHVTGSWEEPKYKADIGGAVDELGRRFKGKNAGEIVDELIGKDEKGQSKAKKLIDKLFR